MSAMTEQRLAEIRARAGAATPGPWRTEPDGRGCAAVIQVEDDGGEEYAEIADYVEGQDAAFIASARQDVPDLLAEVASLREERDRLKGALGEAMDWITFRKTAKQLGAASFEEWVKRLRALAPASPTTSGKKEG